MGPCAARAAATMAIVRASLVTSATMALARGSVCRDLLERPCAAARERHGSARAGKLGGDRGADAGAAAGDQGMLSVEQRHHTRSVAGLGALRQAMQLVAAGQIGLGPGLAGVAELRPRRAASSRDRPGAAAPGSTGPRAPPSGSS